MKYIDGNETTSVLNSINPNQTEALLNSDDGLTLIMGGRYENGRALVFYQEFVATSFLEIRNLDRNMDFFVNIAKWLTRGFCIVLSECVISIDKYKSYLIKDYLVVIYPQSVNVNTSDPELIKKIKSGRWGIIFAGDYFSTIQNTHTELMKKFGICPTKMRNIIKPGTVKWCEKVIQTTDKICG